MYTQNNVFGILVSRSQSVTDKRGTTYNTLLTISEILISRVVLQFSMVTLNLHSIEISIINMILMKVVFLSILIQYGLTGSYLGRENDGTVGKTTLKENYKSIVKKLHQYLKHDLNMEQMISKLQRNSSNSTDGCIKQLLSMNKAQLISGRVLFQMRVGMMEQRKDYGVFRIAVISVFTTLSNAAQKTKFSIKNLFSKCDQICSFLRIWSHLLKKPLMGNFIFCAVKHL